MSRAWKRDRSGGSSGFPVYLGTGSPRAITRKSSLTRTIFQESSSSLVCSWKHYKTCCIYKVYTVGPIKRQIPELQLAPLITYKNIIFCIFSASPRFAQTSRKDKMGKLQMGNSTSSSLSQRCAAMRKRPSSSCISRFSNRLFKTGSTFLSAFSSPSRTRMRPSMAARTAHWNGAQNQKAEVPPLSFTHLQKELSLIQLFSNFRGQMKPSSSTFNHM